MKGGLEKKEDLRVELGQASVAKVTGGAGSKLSKIRENRKSIAPVLTVITAQKPNALKEHYNTKRYSPFELHNKKTRVIRQRLDQGAD